MNNLIVFGACFAVAVCFVVAFVTFHIYGGVHDSLTNARRGVVYNFRYLQPLTGDYNRYLAKVVDIRKLSQDEISRLNFTSDYRVYDKEFHRSPTLVTCLMGDGNYRNFYAERADYVTRPFIAGTLFKLGVAHLF